MVDSSKQQRPTKKQRELLEFVDKFIAEHGYGPSYREIMAGCNYTSVATVAVHVNNLITRGHLRKKDRSARSLELVEAPDPGSVKTNAVKETQEKWLVEKVEFQFVSAEAASSVTAIELENLQVLVGALKVLGLDGAAQSFMPRLTSLKERKL